MATLAATPGRSILDVLPTEIIAMICGLLQKGDCPPNTLGKEYNRRSKALPRDALCNFRLASKDCAAAAESYLFRNLHVLYTRKSFQSLLNISKYANLAKHVRSVFYEPRILESGMDKDDYADYYEGVMYDPGQPISSGTGMEHGWQAYQTLLNEQQFIRKAAWDAAVFTLSLPQFTCLDTITMDMQCFPSYRAVQSVPPPFDRDDNLHEGPHDFYTQKKYNKPLNAIFIATALANVNLVTLHISLVPDELLSSLCGTEDVILPAFKHLRHLSMNLGIFLTSDDRSPAKGLTDLLRSAPGLESLSIKVSSWSKFSQTGSERFMIWDEAIGGLVFPNLERLELFALAGQPSSFVTFFKRHAATLKHVALDWLTLVADPKNFLDIIDVLKNDLSLESAKFGGVWVGVFQGEEKRLPYDVPMGRKIDGRPAHKYVENAVLKRNPALMEKFSTTNKLFTAIARLDFHSGTSEDGDNSELDGELDGELDTELDPEPDSEENSEEDNEYMLEF